MKLSSLSILIPAYKDENTIATVVRRARATGRQCARQFEIIVTNDASPDRTGRVLERLRKVIPELTVITHKENRGYGWTFGELYLAGTKEWLFLVPGDFQIDPMEIQKLIPYQKKADMIIGKRIHRQDGKNRLIQSQIYNRLLRFLFGIPIYDVNSVRLMRKKVIQKTLRSTSAFIDAKITIQAIKHNFRVLEVPIEHLMRKTGGASGGKPSVIFPVIWEMLKYRIELWL